MVQDTILQEWRRDFPGGAEVNYLPSTVGGTCSIPGLGTESNMPQNS